MGCMTVIMSFFNVIFWLIGGTMLGMGIWMLVDEETFSYLQVIASDDIYWEIALYIIISVGGVVFLVGFLGCIGACTDSKFVLVFYGVFVIIAVIAELVAITFVALFYANMGDIGYAMQRDVKYKYISETSYDPLSVSWNSMQIQWQCCGSYGFPDYDGSYFQSNSNPAVKVPWTCCVMKYDVNPKYATKDDVLDYPRCQLEAAQPSYYYFLHPHGCYFDLKNVMDLAAPITLGVLSGFVVIQLIAFGMSCALMKKKSQDVGPGKMM